MRTKSLIAGLVATASIAASAVPGVAAGAPPQATTLEKVSAEVEPGVVYLDTQFEAIVIDEDGYVLNEGEPFSANYSCSGFFVNQDGTLATAGHCVQGGLEARADILAQAGAWSFENERDLWTNGSTMDGAMEFAMDNWKIRSVERPDRARADFSATAYFVGADGHSEGKDLPARLLGYKGMLDGDVALLKVEADNVPALELAPAADLTVGTPAVSVGYPGSVDDVTDNTFDPSFKDGTISSVKTVDGGLYSVYELSSAMSQGMSGGPTVDGQGRVIGINSFGPPEESQPFNFISPVGELQSLMQSEGVENVLGDLTTRYNAALAAFYSGNRQDALKKVDAVLASKPAFELARDLRERVLKLPVPKPVRKADNGGGAPIGIIAIVLALVAAGAAAAANRMRRPGAPQPTTREPTQPHPVIGATATITAPVLRIDVPTLKVIDGPLAGESIEVGGELTLGRGEDAGLRIDDNKVSRRHAQVRVTAEGVELTDLGSSNGTTVNDAIVTGTVELRHGDVIGLGDTTIELDLGAVARTQQATAAHAVTTA